MFLIKSGTRFRVNGSADDSALATNYIGSTAYFYAGLNSEGGSKAPAGWICSVLGDQAWYFVFLLFSWS
jgi:hypothetical protein